MFGENLYAVHSIEYKRLESYYYIFAVRHLDKWLSWEEVKFYAALFDFPTVPELAIAQVKDLSPATLEKQVIDWAKEPSIFGSRDTLTEQDCTCEGIVTRNMLAYPVTDFALLSGLPGMGKDHYIESFCPDIPVVSLDAIRRKYKISPTDKSGNGWVIQTAKEEARSYLRKGQDFIWNATNITRLMRSQLIDLFTGYGARVKLST